MDRNWLTQFNMALDLANAGNFREAEEILANAEAASRSLSENCSYDFMLSHIITLDAIGKTAFAHGNNEVGVSFMLKAAAIQLPVCNSLEEDPVLKRLYSSYCGVLQNLCVALADMGNLENSRAYGLEAVNKAEKYFGAQSFEFASGLMRLSQIPYRCGQYAEARAMLLKAKAVFEKLPDNFDREIGVCLNNLGRVCEESGQIQEGIEWHRKAVNLREKLMDIEDMAFSYGNLGTAHAQAGNLEEAMFYLEKSLECYAKTGRGNSHLACSFRNNLASCAAARSQKEIK